MVLIGHSRKKIRDIEHHSQKALSILFQTLNAKKKKKITHLCLSFATYDHF